jgi:hypothetical protein
MWIDAVVVGGSKLLISNKKISVEPLKLVKKPISFNQLHYDLRQLLESKLKFMTLLRPSYDTGALSNSAGLSTIFPAS